jgi:hypothetical protein
VCAYSWRVPLTVGSCDLKIIASQSLPNLGPVEGRPLLVSWKWYYHAGGAPLWLLTVVLLVAPKANRHRQAWLIFLPLVLLAIVWRMPVRLLMLSEDTAESFGMVVMSCAMAWAAVWLLGPQLVERHGTGRFIVTLALMLVIETVSCLSHVGFDNPQDLLSISMANGFCSTALLLGMTMSSRSCRDGFRRGRFMGWLFGWTALAAMAVMSLFFVAMVLLVERDLAFLGIQLLAMVVFSLFFASVVYLFNLPFILLAFNCPFYRARFHALFCPETPVTPDLVDTAASRYAPPLSTEPTRTPVDVADLVGPWRFYLDDATSTVVVDFKPDGTFTQTVVPNQGAIRQCPGGTWRLEGPLVHLTGYAAVREGTGPNQTWWMVDTSQGPALFGGETTFFRMLRGPQIVDI